jgi:putative hemolysin
MEYINQSISDSFDSEYSPKPLIDIHALGASPLRRFLTTMLRNSLDKTLSISEINAVYERIAVQGKDRFFENALNVLKIKFYISPEDLKKIPKTGPLVVTANHPFGGIEGVILGALMNQVRGDVKIMGNYLLHNIPEIRDQVIPVNPFGIKEAKVSNMKGLKASLSWLRNGGALITFPAGEVSHIHVRKGCVCDPAWSPHIASLIRRTDAAVLPIFFPGKNSLVFQCLGLLHPRFRTALLGRELMNKCDKEIHLYVGRSILSHKVKALLDDAAATEYLRTKTYFLQNRVQEDQKRFYAFAFKRGNRSPRQVPVIAPVPDELLRQEIIALPQTQKLVENQDSAVFYAHAAQIPRLLREIGRLREFTFRQVHEGTGEAVDLDRFDKEYLHLFLWNTHARQLAGAYRLGLTDKILEKSSSEGLYTSTLFRFKPGFLDELGPALELGRSFIRPEYQKKYSSLLLLWQGIGRFILANPQYTTLFGPVSISRNYHVVSRSLIVQFLKETRFDPKLASFVSPKKPWREGKIKGVSGNFIRHAIQDVSDVSVLISEIEKDGKGLPILLQHYLKFNARLIGFNVDKDFSNVVDGLIVVDLKKTDPKFLRRFMGDEGVERIQKSQEISPNQARCSA